MVGIADRWGWYCGRNRSGTLNFRCGESGIFFSGLDPNYGSITVGAMLLIAVMSNDSFRQMAMSYAAKKK
ncbi:MAG: hypothetical protein R3E89_13925 [Thiolinea sp.]